MLVNTLHAAAGPKAPTAEFKTAEASYSGDTQQMLGECVRKAKQLPLSYLCSRVMAKDTDWNAKQNI